MGINRNWMTTPQAAAKFGVTRSTVRVWCERGWIKSELVGGRWFVSDNAVPPEVERGPRSKGKKASTQPRVVVPSRVRPVAKPPTRVTAKRRRRTKAA